ncbi:MAG TPA: carboxy terminal-processing peptidase [Candidatus Limnocylindria bacterium]|nr:carboxy terminal-processing peptidase [Candidatus Limnocylindria bacterium]
MKFRLLALTTLLAASLLRAADPTDTISTAPAKSVATPHDAKPADFFQITAKYTNTLTLEPGPDDSRIAKTVGRFLQSTHYTRHKFDREIGQKMFDRYVDALDPQKLYFLQSDLGEFDTVRNSLDDLTLRLGDTTPACDIFNRFLQRFDESYSLVINRLRDGKFDLASNDTFLVNRKDAPRPKDLKEARKLWADRLRFEYLSEKLNAGDRDTLLGQFTTHLKDGNYDKLTASLTNTFSPEKAAELTQFAKLQYQAAQANAKGASAAKSKSIEHTVALVGQRLAGDEHDEIIKKLTRRYQRTLRNLKQFESDEVLQLWLDSLGHAYDPHTDFMGKRELEQFAMQMNLRLFGIGATLASEDGYTVIREVRPGTPAEKSKQIKVGDKVVGVAQAKSDFVDVIDEKLTKVVEQIRGPKGTEVRLSIIPSGADSSVRKIVSIIRDEIKLEDSEAKAKLVELTGDNGKMMRVGVIDLPSFYANFSVGGIRGSGKTTTGDVAKLLKKLTAEGAEGIILDLRRNGGGSLEEAINLTGLFIKSGPVVQIRNYDGSIQVDEDTDDSVAYDGPLMVLTSRFSASASEIVAAALQDYGRAILVGDSSTHGKGTVQTVQELAPYLRGTDNPGAVKVTIRKFYRASGGSTQLKGVTPDITLPSINSYAEIGETSLDNALAWDTIPSAKIDKVNRVQPYLTELTKRSTLRVNKDKDFDYVREDIERFRKMLADKSVSLNEDKRRAEKAADKARADARKKELAARHDPQPTTYEITLKVADQPGLPVPMTNTLAVLKLAHDAATATNSVAVNAAAPSDLPAAGTLSEPDDDEGEDTGHVATDIPLKEAERILLDLIQLSTGKTGMAAKLP